MFVCGLQRCPRPTRTNITRSTRVQLIRDSRTIAGSAIRRGMQCGSWDSERAKREVPGGFPTCGPRSGAAPGIECMAQAVRQSQT